MEDLIRILGFFSMAAVLFCVAFGLAGLVDACVGALFVSWATLLIQYLLKG